MCMSKNLRLTICVGALLAPFLLGSAGADDHHNNNQYSATFSGFQEIGGLGAGETGAIFSPAQGNLTLNVAKDQQSIKYKLRYSGFTDIGTKTNTVTQSHIHFGKERVAGGIMVYFCTNLTPPPAPAATPQACPLTSGTVSGTLYPADVVGPTGQNVNAGDFQALLAALKSNTAYGNIHTTVFGSGEIRGQILPSENDD
jgi:CHRD domain